MMDVRKSTLSIYFHIFPYIMGMVLIMDSVLVLGCTDDKERSNEGSGIGEVAFLWGKGRFPNIS